jgi:drug/metabolite transporter (DMT)-like permease
VLVRRLFTGRPLVERADGQRRALLPVELALGQCVVGAVVTVGLAAAGDWTRAGASIVPPSPQAWFAVAWLGLLGSGVAYLLFFRIIEAWGATRTTLVTYVMPVVGIILGVVVLRETIDARVLAGTALVIGGIALVNSRFGQRRLYGRSAPAVARER